MFLQDILLTPHLQNHKIKQKLYELNNYINLHVDYKNIYYMKHILNNKNKDILNKYYMPFSLKLINFSFLLQVLFTHIIIYALFYAQNDNLLKFHIVLKSIIILK